MSDNEDADAELLALAGDDSDAESTKEESRSPTPEKPRQKAATQKKTTKVPARRGRAARDVSEDVVSEADSLGSGAMSESDDDDAGTQEPIVEKEAPLFPIEGKFHSEKDRADIMSMPELQREQVLADRAAESERKKQDATLRQLREARQKAEAQAADLKKRKATVADLDDTPRKTTKAKTKATENLEAYKRQREQRNEQRRRNEDKKTGDYESPVRDAEESDRDAEGEKDVEWDEPKARPAPKNEPQPEIRDYERVRVGRTNFAKVCFDPGFDEAIVGCFTRVCIGPEKGTGKTIYRMCQIKKFTQGKPYNLDGPIGRPVLTDQYAVVTQGKQEKEWPFSACSDSKFTDREYDRYKTQLQQDNVRPPTLSFLAGKCTNIQDLLDRKWTDDDINARLKRINAVTSALGERDRLQKARKAAELELDESTIAKIDAQLAALESRLPAANKPAAPRPLTQQEKLAARNLANRKANRDDIRKAQIADRRREQALAEAVARGEKSGNTHARHKTVVKVFHSRDEEREKATEDSELDALFGASADVSARASPAPTTATTAASSASTAGTTVKSASTHLQPSVKAGLGIGGLKKRKQDEDLMAAMDLGIEIDI